MRAASWPQVSLEEVCEYVTVGNVGPMVDEYRQQGVPFLRSQNVRPFRFDPSELKFISAEFHRKLKKSALRPNDVVVTRSGANVGQCCRIPAQLTDANCSDLVIFRPSHRIDPRFLMYVLNSGWGRATIAGGVVGAAQHHFNIGVAKQLSIQLPPLELQARVSGILSAYDELIENSQHRIRLLETMARALYREWFVHFRFPGHENVLRVGSPIGDVPVGWESKPFSAFATYLNGYAFKPSDLGAVGQPIIKIKELKAGISGDTPRNSGNGIPAKFIVRDGDVLFSWSADLDAYRWLEGEGLLNQHLFNVLPLDGISKAFCFHALKEAMPRFRALSLGATMHHIKRAALDQVFALLPPSALRNQFDALVEPMHEQLVTLTRHVRNLRRTRDLLLPRLLSGHVLAGSPDKELLRDRLPRVFALKETLADPLHPDACFQNFASSLSTNQQKLDAFLRFERLFKRLDNPGWHDLKARAAHQLMAKDPIRGWQALFDTLGEAKGFVYLQKLGCTGVKFIPRPVKAKKMAKTPDLEAVQGGRTVLCEVKTINISQDEAQSRNRTYRGDSIAAEVSSRVGDPFLWKVRSKIDEAVEQLDAQDPRREARRIVFTVVHFDDWVGDYQVEYFEQIDEALLKSPVFGAELVFSPASNFFKPIPQMKSATVFEFE